MIWARDPPRGSSSLKELISRKKKKNNKNCSVLGMSKVDLWKIPVKGGYIHCSIKEGFLEKQASQLTIIVRKSSRPRWRKFVKSAQQLCKYNYLSIITVSSIWKMIFQQKGKKKVLNKKSKECHHEVVYIISFIPRYILSHKSHLWNLSESC